MKFVVGENGRNPVKNLPRPRFVQHETQILISKNEFYSSHSIFICNCCKTPRLFIAQINMVSKTSRSIELQFCMISILKIQQKNHKIVTVNMNISKFNKTLCQCPLIYFILDIVKQAASWRKRVDARLPPLGSRVRVSVTPCRFRGGRNAVWVGFFAGFLPFPPTTNFIPPFLHTHLIHFVSFHQPL